MRVAPGRRRLIWRALKWAVAALFALWLVEIAIAFVQVRNQTRVLHAGTLATTLILGPSDLDGPLTDANFDVTRQGSVMIRLGNRVLEVNRGSHFLTDIHVKGRLRSFALGTDGTFHTLASGLGVIGDDGTVPIGQALPHPAYALSPSARPASVLLFGGSGGDYRLYRATGDGKFQLLLHGPAAIVAATDSASTQLAATRTLLVRLGGRRPLIIFKAPSEDWGPILSVAASDDGLIFFSTPDKVFAWVEGLGVSIVNNSGGLLRLRGDELFVLDTSRRLLYSLTPASMAMFRKTH